MADPRIRRSRLPELMKARGLSQVEFAHRVDISESHVSKIISLESKFSLIKGKRAADVLGVHLDDLYEWEY
jgi:transcriptional regulator with XRE-family HTH domain